MLPSPYLLSGKTLKRNAPPSSGLVCHRVAWPRRHGKGQLYIRVGIPKRTPSAVRFSRCSWPSRCSSADSQLSDSCKGRCGVGWLFFDPTPLPHCGNGRILLPLGLTFNQSKSNFHLWSPDSSPPPADLVASSPVVEISTQGFQICRRPLNKVDAQDPMAGSPWGNTGYTKKFLCQFCSDASGFWPLLSCIMTRTRKPCISLSKSCMSMFFPDVYICVTFARTTSTIIVGLPIGAFHNHVVLHTPVSHGGLGTLHPQREAATLPIVEELPAEHEASRAWAGIQDAFGYPNRLAGPDFVVPLHPSTPPGPQTPLGFL